MQRVLFGWVFVLMWCGISIWKSKRLLRIHRTFRENVFTSAAHSWSTRKGTVLLLTTVTVVCKIKLQRQWAGGLLENCYIVHDSVVAYSEPSTLTFKISWINISKEGRSRSREFWPFHCNFHADNHYRRFLWRCLTILGWFRKKQNQNNLPHHNNIKRAVFTHSALQ